MRLAVILTVLAILGVGLGVTLGQSRRLSAHLGAAGGGLLVGMALFGLIPEAAESLGWPWALGVAVVVYVALALLDRLLVHSHGGIGGNVIVPVLILTAIHGFLDGWSLRVTAVGPIAGVTVPIGLALHKLPEGLALGWLVRRHGRNDLWSFLAGSAAEMMTIVGAGIEPSLAVAGQERFGLEWTVMVLSIIAGSFCFLGVHAVWPARGQKSAVALFAATLAVVFAAASLR
jgi:zinc transporter ZupT